MVSFIINKYIQFSPTFLLGFRDNQMKIKHKEQDPAIQETE